MTEADTIVDCNKYPLSVPARNFLRVIKRDCPCITFFYRCDDQRSIRIFKSVTEVSETFPNVFCYKVGWNSHVTNHQKRFNCGPYEVTVWRNSNRILFFTDPSYDELHSMFSYVISRIIGEDCINYLNTISENQKLKHLKKLKISQYSKMYQKTPPTLPLTNQLLNIRQNLQARFFDHAKQFKRYTLPESRVSMPLPLLLLQKSIRDHQKNLKKSPPKNTSQSINNEAINEPESLNLKHKIFWPLKPRFQQYFNLDSIGEHNVLQIENLLSLNSQKTRSSPVDIYQMLQTDINSQTNDINVNNYFKTPTKDVEAEIPHVILHSPFRVESLRKHNLAVCNETNSFSKVDLDLVKQGPNRQMGSYIDRKYP